MAAMTAPIDVLNSERLRAKGAPVANETERLRAGQTVRANMFSIMGIQTVVESDSLYQLINIVKRVAPTQNAVLILGESGSGKELIARAVHQFSPRSAKAWIDINCAALPAHLLESELFGYEKGAFSGAETSK